MLSMLMFKDIALRNFWMNPFELEPISTLKKIIIIFSTSDETTIIKIIFAFFYYQNNTCHVVNYG